MRIWVGFCVFVIAVTGLAFLLLRAQIQLYQNGFLYAYGPYEFTRSIQELSMQIDSDNQQFSADAAKTAHPDWTGGAFLNRHSHSKVLADQTFRSVTTPNNDTLYTSAVLELSATPVELVLPAIGGRYQSVALMDLFTDQFAHIGPRETGGEAGVYWIIGPEDDTPVPANVKVIRATGNDVWLLGRTFVSGSGDLDAARAAQSGMTVRPVFPDRPTRPFSTLVTDITDSANFLAVTNEALARNSHHPHSARADQYKAIGIGPDAGTGTWSDFLWARLTARIEAAMSEQINQTLAAGAGWSKPSRTIGFYGEDDTFRSAVALIGFGALRLEDAIYYRATRTAMGEPFDGRGNYQLQLPADVPARAFWSISLYAPDETGRFYFFENATGRHSLNSGSAGLQYQPDGQVTLHIGPHPPAGGVSNWLPTPEGPFAAFFRVYDPEEQAVADLWMPPPIVRE